MVYDLNMLKSFYASYKGKMEHVRAALKRPLTLAEKILYTHLYNVADLKIMKGVKTMSTFARTALLCRMLLLRWLCCNL